MSVSVSPAPAVPVASSRTFVLHGIAAGLLAAASTLFGIYIGSQLDQDGWWLLGPLAMTVCSWSAVRPDVAQALARRAGHLRGDLRRRDCARLRAGVAAVLVLVGRHDRLTVT